MNFDWNPEQDTAYDRLIDEVAKWDRPPRQGFFTDEDWKRCAGLGVLGLSVPAEYGGSGLDALTTARVAEAFGRSCQDMGLVFAAMAHLLACAMPIAEHGDAALKAAVLPRLCSGEWIGANAITEDEAGSDVTAVTTRAERQADGAYLLTGEKSFVSNGPVADLFLVYATTDPRFGHLGVSAFVVERDTPGLVAGPAFDKLGPAGCPAGRLTLDHCRVPAGHLVGRPGTGSAVFQSSMSWERTCLFAAYLGAAGRTLERCVERAGSRHQFGRPIGSNQAVSHRLADVHLRLEAARLLLHRACWKRDRNTATALDVAMAKLAASESVVETHLEALRLFGGAGVLSENGIEQALRDALPSTIFSGTSDMQRELMVKAMGL
ncbi:acyl-CoA dehydrogenase family protein [Streptomyces sp. NPDC014733]|uniref:acyl-CoA dehydrogenase family protein n=1 Tax=Streptomyces sp. NPDC014733 TaxID=3364885 RepID=UPI0036F58A15